jgi:hypothetical protein
MGTALNMSVVIISKLMIESKKEMKEK